MLALNPTIEKWLDPVALTAFIVALTALLASLRSNSKSNTAQKQADDANSKSDVNTTNTQTNATAIKSLIHAQNASPGPNVPQQVSDAIEIVATTPTIPVEPPTQTMPVVAVPTPEVQARAFDASKSDST